jgi:osmotically-inducible protein OsmY
VITAAKVESTARMRQDVEQELGCEPSVDAAAIGVAVEDGLVTLSGHVASHAEKLAAEHASARVRGVKAIVNELEVKLPDSSHSADEEIAKAAVESLSWNTQIPADRIKVRVEHGWISLEGDVDWRYQKTGVRAADTQGPADDVVSQLAVLHPVSMSRNPGG